MTRGQGTDPQNLRGKGFQLTRKWLVLRHKFWTTSMRSALLGSSLRAKADTTTSNWTWGPRHGMQQTWHLPKHHKCLASKSSWLQDISLCNPAWTRINGNPPASAPESWDYRCAPGCLVLNFLYCFFVFQHTMTDFKAATTAVYLPHYIREEPACYLPWVTQEETVWKRHLGHRASLILNHLWKKDAAAKSEHELYSQKLTLN